MNHRYRILAAQVAGVFACLLAIDGAALAAPGTVSMSWGTCSPIVSDVANPPAGPLSLVFSVEGSDETHTAYQVRFLLLSSAVDIPDAWAFDATGCQGSAMLAMNHRPPAALAASCPPFDGNAERSLQIKDFNPLPDGMGGVDVYRLRGVLASTYPATTANPAQRYFLAEFRFDHTFSVSGPTTPGVNCGGFETPMCVQLLYGPPGTIPGTSSYIRESDGMEYAFLNANEFVTVRSGGDCVPPVPAARSTWGQIKSHYRK